MRHLQTAVQHTWYTVSISV